jgi:hypothetical protein
MSAQRVPSALIPSNMVALKLQEGESKEKQSSVRDPIEGEAYDAEPLEISSCCGIPGYFPLHCGSG